MFGVEKLEWVGLPGSLFVLTQYTNVMVGWLKFNGTFSTTKLYRAMQKLKFVYAPPRAGFSWWEAWDPANLGVTRWDTVKALGLKIQY